jgi:hypothetical protein
MNTISTASSATDSIAAATNAFAEILAPKGTTEGNESEAQQTEQSVVESPAPDEQAPEAQADGASDDGDDPEYDEESDEEESEEPAYTVKVNGEEVTVTLDELRQGYSRTQDYTRKTQQLAEQRKMAEAEFEAVRAERQQYSQVLNTLQQQIEASAPSEPNWEHLRHNDPIEFAAQWAEHQQRQQRLQAVQAEQQRLASIQQQEQAQWIAQVVADERKVLENVIPEWRDPEVAKREKGELVEFARKLGFQTEELAGVTDHRVVVALRKAHLYEKLMSRKPEVRPAQRPAAPVLKPGSSTSAVTKRTGELTRAKQRLAKTGAVRDAATAFESILLGKAR